MNPPPSTAETGKLSGHSEAVYAVEYSADGRTILTASFDKSLRLWDAKSLRTSAILAGHTEIVLAGALTRDGRRAASGALDKTIKLWDIPAGLAPAATPAQLKPAADLTGHTAHVYSVAFNPDGTLLASASHDMTVRLWDVATKKAVKTVSTQSGPVYSAVFSPDGKTLATGGTDPVVRAFQIADGKEIARYTGPEHPIYSVAFAPDGQTIAGAGVGLGGPRRIFLWKPGEGKPARVLEEHPDDVYRVQFSPSGKRLLSVGYAGNVLIWDLAAGRSIARIKLGGARPMIVYGGAFSPDGRTIAVAAGDAAAHLFAAPAEG